MSTAWRRPLVVERKGLMLPILEHTFLDFSHPTAIRGTSERNRIGHHQFAGPSERNRIGSALKVWSPLPPPRKVWRPPVVWSMATVEIAAAAATSGREEAPSPKTRLIPAWIHQRRRCRQRSRHRRGGGAAAAAGEGGAATAGWVGRAAACTALPEIPMGRKMCGEKMKRKRFVAIYIQSK